MASTGDRTAQVTAVGPGTTSIVASFGGSGGTATIVVSAALGLQLVASGLIGPLYVTQPAADPTRLFVVEQAGRIKVIQNGTPLPTPFLDITSLVLFSGERGMLSMAFHPNYANNGQFFVYYTDLSGNIQIARYTVSSTDANAANAGSAQPNISIWSIYSSSCGDAGGSSRW